MSEEPIEPEVMEWPTFQDFYDTYDKKRGRPNAEKYWKKLTQAEKEACMAAVPAYLKSTPDKKYRKDPERYLRHKCWEDEVIGTNEKGAGQAGPTVDDKKREVLEHLARRQERAGTHS